MPATPLPPEFETLSAMITPAIFLTANGSLIISTSNRMSRIVDRIRVLNELADRLGRGDSGLDFPDDRMGHVDAQLRSLIWRSDRIRFALIMLYLAFSAFVGSSLVLALDVVLSHRIPHAPTSLAVLGVSLMLASGMNLVREALEALRGNRVEVRFYRTLQERRRAGVGAADRPGP
jgi:hypothetical protein